MKKISLIILGFITVLTLAVGSAATVAPSALAKKPHCKKDEKVIKGKCQPKNCPNGRKSDGSCKPKAGDTGKKGSGSTSGGNTCGDAQTYFNFGCGGSSSDKGGKDNPIVKILASVIKIVTGGVGLVAIGGVVTGGIIYSTAGGNSETAKKGLSFIFNSVIGLALYAFAVSILNFAIPGGLFN